MLVVVHQVTTPVMNLALELTLELQEACLVLEDQGRLNAHHCAFTERILVLLVPL